MAPAAAGLGLTAIRADQIGKPGQITTEVVDHVRRARIVVADLTGHNPNVYWELGVRHALRLPAVLIADAKEEGGLPFDLLQMRTVFYRDSLRGAAAARIARRRRGWDSGRRVIAGPRPTKNESSSISPLDVRRDESAVRKSSLRLS